MFFKITARIDRRKYSYYDQFGEKNMKKVLIIYSPEKHEIREVSDRIAEMFDEGSYSVSVKNAAGTEVPDITASDIVLFGSEDSGKDIKNGDYKELSRALSGISLAGRKASVFALSSEDPLISLSEMIKDCELTLPVKSILLSKDGKLIKDKKIEQWIHKICS